MRIDGQQSVKHVLKIRHIVIDDPRLTEKNDPGNGILVDHGNQNLGQSAMTGIYKRLFFPVNGFEVFSITGTAVLIKFRAAIPTEFTEVADVVARRCLTMLAADIVQTDVKSGQYMKAVCKYIDGFLRK